MVNNKAVYNENLRIAKEIHEVRTTTLSIEDFFERNDTCQTQPVHLLYAGRLDLEKGLIEMVEATAQLAREQYNVVLNLVGWENHGSNIITTKLKALSRKLGVADRVIFHGKKRIGEDLNLVYRASDIFLIASKGSEGFPRTIWEAMANSVPVIASKAGSIPLLLKDRQHCLLIEQNSSGDIVEKIKNLINDPTLRQRLIREGRLLVRENTLEIQAQRMVGLLKSYLHKEKLEIKTIPAS
jgi:glycosyltransferase involved in cell wall biosynthesis